MWVTVALVLVAQGQAAPIESDPRLAGSVTTRADALTLKEWCNVFGETVGVPLVASSGIAEHLVVVYAWDRPAHEIMRVVAQHYDWEWRRSDGGGYQMVQTAESASSDEADLRQTILNAYKPYREDALEFIEKRKTADPAEARKKITETSLTLDALQQGDHLESARLHALGNAYTRELGLHWEVIDHLMASMTDQDWLDLERSSAIVFATRPTAAQRMLPKEAVQALQKFVEIQFSDYMDLSSSRFHLLNWFGHLPREGIGDRFHKCRITIQSHDPVMGSLEIPALFASFTILDSEGESIYQNSIYLSTRQRTFPPQTPLPVLPEDPRLDGPLPQTAGLLKAIENKPLFWKQFLKFRDASEPLAAQAAIVNEVAAAAGFCVVADVFDHSPWLYFPSRYVTRSEALGSLVLGNTFEWEINGDWARLRSRTAGLCALHRHREAP